MTEQPTPTPPPSPGWWTRRSIVGKIGTIAGGIFVALLVIGLVAPAPEDQDKTSAKAKDTGSDRSATKADEREDDEQDASSDEADEPHIEEAVEKEPAPPADPVYTLSFSELRATDGGALLVAGTTNLPDGTKLELTATRVFLNKGETEPRAARLSTEPLIAEGGKFAVDTVLDESEVATFADAQFPVAAVSRNVHVCVTVQTGEDFDGNARQPGDVADVLGEAGEQLNTSPLAQEFGGATDTPTTMLELAKSIPANPADGVLLLREKQGSAPRVAALEGFCA